MYLDANRRQLAETGIHYPLAGRYELAEGLYTPGHHQIAFDFGNEDGSASFAAVVNEIRLVQSATVVLRSEEFLPSALKSGVLETIVATGRGLGYEPVAVVVLRAQPDYLESIYSELTKTSSQGSLDDLIEQAAHDGCFTPKNYRNSFELTYTAVVARLEAIFGGGNVIARAYRPDRGPDFGHTDFLGVVGYLRGGLNLRNANNPSPRVNERVTLLQLLASIVRRTGANLDVQTFVREHFPLFNLADLERPFSLITRADRLCLLSRFAADNAALNARFEIDIPFVSAADVAMTDADDARAQEQRVLLSAVLSERRTIAYLPGGPRRRDTLHEE